MDNQSEAIKNVYLHEDGKAVTIIDQTKLPTVTEYLTLGTAKDLYDAIFELKVRGAPAIGICAAFGMGITGQIIVFAAVSFVLLYFTRPWALKYLKPHLVKTNYEEAVGKNVCVTEQIDNVRGTGTAVMNGLEWTARSVDDEKTFEPGMIVMVKEIKGVTLYVTESSDMPQMNGDK